MSESIEKALEWADLWIKQIEKNQPDGFNSRVETIKILAASVRSDQEAIAALETKSKMMREALRYCAHWFNEITRLDKDVSQTTVARNFQIGNWAKAGFDIALHSLQSSSLKSEETK